MKKKRNIHLFIQDVFDAIDKINGYVSGFADKKALRNDKKTYDAVMMNFIIVGEAVRNIYEDVRENYPNIEWKEIMAMRNLLVHEYWGVNEAVVWDCIKNDLPELQKILAKVRDGLN